MSTADLTVARLDVASRLLQSAQYILCMIFLSIIGCGGASPLPYQTECDPALQALLVSDDVFPSDWSAAEPHLETHTMLGAREVCVVFFYTVSGVAFEDLYEYGTLWSAQRHFGNIVNTWTFGEPTNVAITQAVSENVELANTSANTLHIECIDNRYGNEQILMCEFFARYGQIVAHFHSTMSSSVREFMTVDEFAVIVEQIDRQMSGTR